MKSRPTSEREQAQGHVVRASLGPPDALRDRAATSIDRHAFSTAGEAQTNRAASAFHRVVKSFAKIAKRLVERFFAGYCTNFRDWLFPLGPCVAGDQPNSMRNRNLRSSQAAPRRPENP